MAYHNIPVCTMHLSHGNQILERVKKCPAREGRGLSLDLIIFCELKPHVTFQNPRTTPSGRKVMEEKEEERKNKWHSG